MILICVIRLTHPRTLCGLQKLVRHYMYLLEALVFHHFMISWWMVSHKKLSQLCIHRSQYIFRWTILVWSSNQWYFISQDLERFGFMNEQTIPTPVLLSDLRWLPFSGCGRCMEMMVCLIGTIYCQLRNPPPIFCICFWGHNIFSVWQTVRMGPLSFGLGVSVVGGWSLKQKFTAMRLQALGRNR